MDHDALLRRIARTLKKEIAPNVEGEYPKTQAFMAAVVLEKLAGEIGSASHNANSDQSEREQLALELAQIDAGGVILDSLSRFITQLDEQSLCELISEIYAEKQALGKEVSSQFLGRIRNHLRASIDRRMEYSA
ncbi:MAG: hypothetical protein ACU84Q_17610 [Gammaproteobacteria bacterium]